MISIFWILPTYLY